ncbi:MAG: SusC/RagA family TonB-linked outer membrane protein [Saprospirales bacterium]|nr:SusC/RagA family TonB-linked outer membrane protein [Saprospirales bacterium]MBK8921218.1 SusC/RagA family TonB-linked outer membrane protein [Saprospirales bacterium]
MLLAFMMLLSNFAVAQRTVTGKVTDAENGEPLIGATVTVVGTTRGAVTDIDGAYSVQVPEGSTQLRYAYTGYAEQVVDLTASNAMDIAMKPGTLLDEVVVVGYGAVRKTDATGAVTSVTEESFNKGVIVAPEQLIQGRAAGVQITSSSGEPGAGINIRIRGTSSVRSGNNPLFVVDGVPLSGNATQGNADDNGFGASTPRNPLNFLNPNDIASIDILKDASATAIYGSRGANGVVIITTKSGATGKGVLDYSYSLGISQITKKYDLLDSDAFLAAYADFNGQAAADLLDGGANTDWQDEVLQTAMTNNHNLSYGGGDSRGSYRFSLSYQDQEGIIRESGLTKYTARFNGARKFLDDRLTIGTQITIADNHDDNPQISRNAGFEGDAWSSALKANPSQAVRDANGDFIQKSNTEPNPVAMIELAKDFTNTLRALGNLSAELKLTNHWSFKTVLGFDRSLSERKTAYSRDLNITGTFGKGRLYLYDVANDNRLWENYFTYSNRVGALDITGLAGYSYQSFEYSNKRFEMTNFATSDMDLMINNFASADQATNKSSIVGRNSSLYKDELQSYFGRVILGLRDKYILTATLRADGSTRFGGDNQYGYFPSFAFKWRMIQEEFVPDAFSDLGLRVGYGVTGNQELPHNLYQQRQRYGDWNIENGGNITGGGLGDVAFPNPGLKWESTTQINVGLDFGFANNRIAGSLDFYKKNTADLLIKVTAAQPAVSPFVWKNLDADVQNLGLELSLNIAAIDKPDFEWNVLANAAYNKNEVKRYGGLINTGEINGQGLTGAFAQRIAEGQPLFAFFLRDFGGFDDNGITIYPGGDVQRFVDASPIPKVTAGLTNAFRYKNLDLSIFLNGQFGHYIYSNTANAYFTAGSLANGRNVTTDVVGNGESNLNSPDVSTRFLEKGDFVRLQDVSLGYRFNLKSRTISALRIFVTAQNLAVFTGYSGQDPEVNVDKSLDEVPSLGIDYSAYPRARTFLFGANISF